MGISKSGGLDETDRKILALLQQDGRLTNAKLAEQLNLSETPCWRRLKRLESEGYIEGYQARLNRHKLGLGVIGFAQVTFGDHSGQAPIDFEHKMAQMPEILSCHNVSGDCDYILQIVADDLESYGDFVRDKLRILPGISSIRSSLSLREVKAGVRMPV
ncbi:Lrp/AsnC family transcriptional regulator [Oceanospirillum sanctuarii]|uniref:Lrp/AsnC family transcriptional regulator n=1 Tax=Oceanospirillum sanctuarii TaxID=1434821 RepID=UPI000A36518F|nr:Lrp/AsnC family transcriptional regulator [Oceanospirillum sanctuarii]